MIGIALVAAGFVYDLAYAGIPFQDPTPELTARWQHHGQVAAVTRLVGYAITSLGSLALLVFNLWSILARRASGREEFGGNAQTPRG